jgi:hypothetical protein
MDSYTSYPKKHMCLICNNNFELEMFLKHYISCHNEKIGNIVELIDNDITKIKVKNHQKICKILKNGYINLDELCENCIYNNCEQEDIEDF